MSVPVTVTYLSHAADCRRHSKEGGTCTCEPEAHRTFDLARDATGGDALRVQVRTTLLPFRREGRASQASRHLREISK